jgi:hypothetical protein
VSANANRSQARTDEKAAGPKPLSVATALWVINHGWVPVRVGYRDKIPTGGKGWQDERPTAADVARWGVCNVGVLLGAASNWLTDIDLDTPEAIGLAPHYLPPTWVFGRTSKPRSHWFYIAEGARSHKFLGIDDETMLEVRAESSDTSGHQTVIPPSIHVSGESIEWDPDCGDSMERPLVIAWPKLADAVAKLARATLYMRADGLTADQAIAAERAHVPKPPPKPVSRPRRQASGDVEKRARQYLAKLPESISHQGGHLALFRAAVALVRGFNLDEGAALALLEQEFNPRCQPEWRTKDLERKVRHAVERSRKPYGYLLDGGSR